VSFGISRVSTQARGQIDGIADHRVVARLLRTDIAHDHIAGGDADADIDLGKAAPETGDLGERGAESGKAGELIECGQTSGPGMIVRAGEGRGPKRP
jgi:hypothetical protein